MSVLPDSEPEPPPGAPRPAGSLGARVDRVWWLARLTAAKMKEGPVPLYRAVRRGLFEALPPAWKATLARRRYRIPHRTRRRLALAGHGCEEPGLVSVVLPVFNQADMLAGSVASILSQTYPHWELILVDDGSTDGIDPVLAGIDDSRVRLLTQPNLKLPHALTNGFRFARGEFRTWTSADNLMEPGHLERLVEHLRAHPATAMVYADYLVIGPDGHALHGSDFRPQNRSSPESAAVHLPRNPETLGLLQDNFIGACFLYRGWVGRCLGPYSAALGVEDYDYWMRIHAEFRLEHLGTDELLYRYRWHDNSLSGQSRELRLFEAGQALMRHERERAGWRGEPWRIAVDADQRPWVAAVDPESVLLPLDAALQGPGKCLVIASAAELDPDDLDLVGNPAPVYALDWSGDPTEVYRWGDALDAQNLAHFTTDPVLAATLALFTDRVFEVPAGAERLALALAFGNDVVARIRGTVPDPSQLPQVWHDRRRPMRLLLQVDDFVQGGLECVVLDLAATLGDQGIDCCLLVLGQQGEMADRARQAGIEILSLDLQETGAYRDLLQDRSIDLVLAHHSLFGAAVAAEAGVGFVQTLHNTYHWFYPDQIAAWRANDPATTAYVHVSANVALFAHEKLGLTPTKSLILPNGVALPQPVDPADQAGTRRRIRAEYGFGDTDYVFLHVASIYPPKSQLWIAHALAAALVEEPRLRVILLGRVMDEAYGAELERTIATLGLEGSLVVAGYHPDPEPFYQAADAFLLPSYWEGCSLAVAEARLRGLTCVLTEVGAARQQAGGDGIYLRPPHPVRDLDFGILSTALRSPRPDFVADLAQALRAAAEHRPEPADAREVERLRNRFDRRGVGLRYGNILRWLHQGGAPAAARPYARARYEGGALR